MSIECAVYLQVLHPQGKNITELEFNALGDMLASMTWELPAVQEYKNELVVPDFLALPGAPASSSNQQMLVPAVRGPDPADPASKQQWVKIQKMVAWLRFSL